MTQEGQILGGKFQVLKTLGEGGMGVVYEVLHVITQHRRALKVLRLGAGADENERTRLLREASAAGRIGNAHITETYDAGSFDTGETYVLMEILAGESLATALKRRRRFPVAEAVDIIRQTCEALTAAHAANIVHRDIKPANLFLTFPEGPNSRPFVKVLDFGVSKFDAGATEMTDLTGAGMLIGTLAYMPPEQIQGSKNVDGRADVYALAVTLYTMIAGKRPFSGNSMPNVALNIVVGQYEPIRTIRPDLPAGLPEAISRAMAASLDERTPTAEAFAAELLPFLDAQASPEDASFADAGPWSERGSSSRSGPGPSSGGLPSEAMGAQPPPSIVVPTIANAGASPLLQARGPQVVKVIDKDAPADGGVDANAEPPSTPSSGAVDASKAGPPSVSSIAVATDAEGPESNGPHGRRGGAAASGVSRGLLLAVAGGIVVLGGLLAFLTRPTASPESEARVTAAASGVSLLASASSPAMPLAPSAASSAAPSTATSVTAPVVTAPAATAPAVTAPAVTATTVAPPTVVGTGKKPTSDRPPATGKPPLHRENPY